MSDLATRLEAGPGSRELSDLVLKKLGWRRALTNRPDLRGWWFRPDQPDDDDWPTNSPPSPAESVDDGLALLREMNGWKLDHLMHTSNGWSHVKLYNPRHAKKTWPIGLAATEALALSAALVRAAEA